MITPLPEAPAEIRRFFEDWLERFAASVREVDYAAARPLWHPDVLVLGTHRDVVQGREAAVVAQWDKVWPRTEGFRFDVAAARVLASDDGSMAVVITPWTSTGFHRDGTKFDRPGRATLVFHRASAGEDWLCVHSHMSLNRGVPQESFGDRPVKAR
jgi:ketosteroid isomerase-like protein